MSLTSDDDFMAAWKAAKTWADRVEVLSQWNDWLVENKTDTWEHDVLLAGLRLAWARFWGRIRPDINCEDSTTLAMVLHSLGVGDGVVADMAEQEAVRQVRRQMIARMDREMMNSTVPSAMQDRRVAFPQPRRDATGRPLGPAVYCGTVAAEEIRKAIEDGAEHVYGRPTSYFAGIPVVVSQYIGPNEYIIMGGDPPPPMEQTYAASPPIRNLLVDENVEAFGRLLGKDSGDDDLSPEGF